MRVVREVLAVAGAAVDWENAVAGAEAFRRSVPTGAPQETLVSIAAPAWC